MHIIIIIIIYFYIAFLIKNVINSNICVLIKIKFKFNLIKKIFCINALKINS